MARSWFERDAFNRGRKEGSKRYQGPMEVAARMVSSFTEGKPYADGVKQGQKDRGVRRSGR